MVAAQRASFIQSGDSRAFLMSYLPAGAAPPSRCYVVAPAFSEEMNRSRDVLRAFATAAAVDGKATFIPDLRGTGDSPGSFGEFAIDDWCADLAETVRQVQNQYPGTPITLLAVRFGALLAARTLNSIDVDDLLLWQPVVEGRRQVRELLRVWSAANLASRSPTQEDPWTLLEQHGALEIAGYRLTQELASEMTAMRLWLERPMQMRWIEAGANLPPRTTRWIDSLVQNGHSVDTALVDCAPFWRIQERVDSRAFVAASLKSRSQETESE
ncbi:MAG: alpha/beta hydrolase [Pseudomonadota bacterium]